jgi:trigger factor
LKITKEETSSRQVELNIELDSADIEPYLDRSYKRLVNRLNIPGFRRGKAPRFIVENYVGRESLVRESLDLIARESLDKAIEEENLQTFGEPDVELVEFDPISLKAVVPLEPVVELGDFRSIRLEPETVEVTEEQVDGVLEKMRYDSAPWEPVDRPVKFGDLVTLDLDAFIDGESVGEDRGIDFIPALENPFPLPGFSVHMEGIAKDESKEFTLTVPEDYQDTTIAGKECRFNVKALEIKEKALPELDDEFAKGVGDEGHEDLEALRASVLESLTEQSERIAQRAFQEKSLEQVISGASIVVSELTTNREIDHLLEEQARALERSQMDMDTYLQNVGKSREELREEVRPDAEERLTRSLVIRNLAREEGIEVSPEEIEAEIENLASGSGESSEALYQALSSDSMRGSIGNSMLTRKVLERLAQIATGDMEETGEEGSQEEGSAPIQDAEASVEEGDAGGPAPAGDAEAGQAEEEGGNPSDNQPQ